MYNLKNKSFGKTEKVESMKKALLYLCFTVTLFAYTSCEQGAKLAQKLHLVPGAKASIQWKRIFQNEHKKKRYKLHTLSHKEIAVLKDYLIKHAADSPQPLVPGL